MTIFTLSFLPSQFPNYSSLFYFKFISSVLLIVITNTHTNTKLYNYFTPCNVICMHQIGTDIVPLETSLHSLLPQGRKLLTLVVFLSYLYLSRRVEASWIHSFTENSVNHWTQPRFLKEKEKNKEQKMKEKIRKQKKKK